MNSTPIIGYDPATHTYYHIDGGTTTAEEVHANGGPPPNVPDIDGALYEARMVHILDQVDAGLRELGFIHGHRADDPRDE